jgi:hypothetical protein
MIQSFQSAIRIPQLDEIRSACRERIFGTSSEEFRNGRGGEANSMDLMSLGLTPAELQLTLLETALRALTLCALLTIGATSLVYFMLWLAEFRRFNRSGKSRR